MLRSGACASAFRLLVAAGGISAALVIGGLPLLTFVGLYVAASTLTAVRLSQPGRCTCACTAWQQLLSGEPDRFIAGVADVGIAATAALQALGSRGSLGAVQYAVLFLLLLSQICVEIMLRPPTTDRTLLPNTDDAECSGAGGTQVTPTHEQKPKEETRAAPGDVAIRILPDSDEGRQTKKQPRTIPPTAAATEVEPMRGEGQRRERRTPDSGGGQALSRRDALMKLAAAVYDNEDV